MDLNYASFFEIEMLHEYFTNQKCCEFDIVPSAETTALAKNLGLQWRVTGNRLVAMIKVNELNEPFINRPNSKLFRKFYGKSVFRFYLRLKDPSFGNYTNIELRSSTARKLYYFSNAAANKKSGKLFLTEPIDEFHLNKTYLPGDLIYDAGSETVLEAVKKQVLKKKAQIADRSLWKEKGLRQGIKALEEFGAAKLYLPGDVVLKPATAEVFECQRRHTSTGPAELEDPLLWIARENGSIQYTGAKDSIDLAGAHYRFPMPAALDKAETEISAWNNKTSRFDVTVKKNEPVKYPEKITQIPVDLTGLEAGRYQVTLNKESRIIYYDPAINAVNTFGVIEISNELPGEDAYALVTDDEQLKKPLFTIHFANRRVLWKYVRKDGKAQTVIDTGDTGYEFQLNGDDFVSTLPIPLSETVCKTLKLDFNTKDFRLFPLPNPVASNLGKFRQDDYDYLCSEVYLNY